MDANLLSNLGMQQPMNGAGNQFYNNPYMPPPPPPVSQFMLSLNHVATQELPKIEVLARAALDGINRAYEPDTDPSHTAAALDALRAALGNLYDILKESGVGALPLNPDPEPEAQMLMTSVPDPRVVTLTDQVNAIFKEGKAARDRATVVLDMLNARDARDPAPQ